MIFDFRKNKNVITPLKIKNEDVEIVKEYKYLGTFIDEDLNWNRNTKHICCKANQRLYFLRKLKSFQANQDILFLFYESVIQSVITFSIIVWYNCLNNSNLKKLKRITKTASRIIGIDVRELNDICEKALSAKFDLICADRSHPLNSEIKYSRSGRIVPSLTRTNRYKFSFLPCAIRAFNLNFKR